MSAVLDRTRARPGPLGAGAGLAALMSAGAGIAVCVCVAMAGWLVASTGTAGDAVRAGVQAWLLGLGAGLRVGSVTVTAIPLGLTALSALLLWRTGRWAATSAGAADVRAVVAGTSIVAAVFATTAAAGALLSSTTAASVSPVRAFVAALLLAAVFAGLGMLRGAGLAAALWRWLPVDARAALHGGCAAATTLLAAGALLVTAALAADLTDAANVAHATGAGVVGGAILTLAGVLLLPNAALFAVAYVLGPGFAFGAGTTVAPGGVVLGKVPAFPLLAALPNEGAGPWWVPGLLAVPVLAGLVAGAVAVRHHPARRLHRTALRGGLAGLLGGAGVAALTGLAGGAVGPGRLTETGPAVLACMASAAVAVTLGAVVGALLVAWRARRRTPASR